MVAFREFLNQALDGNKRARFILLGGAGFCALVAAFLFTSGDTGTSSVVPITAPTSTSKANSFDNSIWVDIVGAIENPGVYSLKPGARVFEVVALAGGFTRDADKSSINLARNLTDGEQINVLPQNATTFDTPQSTLISINSASAATLETLPGVGPKLAARIVDWRGANSGFQKIADLRKVGGIGDKLFAAIKDLVSL